MKFPIVKHSIVVAGRKTSVSLEDEFWKAFREIASERDLTLSDLAATIDDNRHEGNLSSAIRQFVLGQYRNQISEHQGRAAHERLVAGAAHVAH